MENHDNSPNKRQDKDNKIELLKAYLLKLKFHPPVIEHYPIAKSFGVHLYKPLFRADAIRRFLTVTHSEPTTAATVSKLTGITHKYLCQLKKHLEEEGLLKVIGFGKCPTTWNQGVQFLSSNKQDWPDSFPKTNQLKMF